MLVIAQVIGGSPVRNYMEKRPNNLFIHAPQKTLSIFLGEAQGPTKQNLDRRAGKFNKENINLLNK
jgi:hypothetical protein